MFKLLVFLALFMVIMPALINLLDQYITLVILGDMPNSEFRAHFPQYSFMPVFRYYWDLFDALRSFLNNLFNKFAE